MNKAKTCGKGWPALLALVLVAGFASGVPAWAAGKTDPARAAENNLPNVAMSMTALTFPAQPVGTSSPSQTIFLSNRSQAMVTLSGIVAIGDFTETNNCWTGLQPGGLCAIKVTFRPTAVGRRGGAVMIPSSPVQFVALLGSATGPEASLSSRTVQFPDTVLGATSAPQPVVLSNPGSAPLRLSSVAALGDFSQTNDCGGSIAPRGKCMIQVSFTPTRNGPRSGAILVSDNSAEKMDVILPLGRGTSPEAALSSGRVEFGTQPVGTLGMGKELRLTNRGNAPLIIRGWTTTGDFSQLNNCPGTIPPQGQCVVQLTFKPGAAGERSGTLAFDSNNPQAESVRLHGVGTDFGLQVTPDSNDIKKKDTATYSVQITPVDGFSGMVNLACSGAPDGSTCSFDNPAMQLSSSDPATVTMTVTPPDDHQDRTVGTHTLTITAASGTVVRHVVAMLKVKG